MSKPDNDLNSLVDDISTPSSSLLDEGWAAEEEADTGGSFASEHTTVDPSLLDRLAALDGKDLFAKKGKPAANGPGSANAARVDAAMKAAGPPGGENTINLDINDLVLDEVAEGEPTQAIAIPEDLLPRTQAIDIPPGLDQPPTLQIDQSLTDDANDPDYSSLAAEKTQIFMPAMEDEPTRAKLKLIQGGGQQKEYLLARDRVTLGRGTNNDILVPDIAISRQHCEIIRNPDGTFRMRDMNSGNGTKLNGTRVLDSDLFGGDRIELGSTILEFVITGPGASRNPGDRKINVHPSESVASAPAAPAATPAPRQANRGPAVAPAPPPPAANYASVGNATATHYASPPAPAAKSGNGVIIGLIAAFAILFLVLAAGFGAKIYLDTQKGAGGEAVANKPAKDYYFEGVEAIKARDWEASERSFTIAVDLAKEEHDFDTKKDAEVQLDRVRGEKTNEVSLKRGKELVDTGSFPEAIAKLESITSGSVYYTDARETIEDARNKRADKLVVDASKDFEDEDYKAANAKITQALAVLPEHSAAKALREKLLPHLEDDKEDSNTGGGGAVVAARPPRPNVDNGGGNSGGSDSDNGGKATPPPKDPPTGGNTPTAKKASGGIADLTPGLALYRNKRFSEAIAFFQKIADGDSEGFSGKKAAELAASIRAFQTSYDQGEAAFKGGDFPKASQLLTKALRDDVKISGSGYHKAAINEMLAEAHYQQARAAYNGQNYSRAGVHAKLALQYKPAHTGNRALLDELEGQAKSMYIDARAKKATDPKQAKKIAQAIVAMLPGTSDTHQKAKKLLSEL